MAAVARLMNIHMLGNLDLPRLRCSAMCQTRQTLRDSCTVAIAPNERRGRCGDGESCTVMAVNAMAVRDSPRHSSEKFQSRRELCRASYSPNT